MIGIVCCVRLQLLFICLRIELLLVFAIFFFLLIDRLLLIIIVILLIFLFILNRLIFLYDIFLSRAIRRQPIRCTSITAFCCVGFCAFARGLGGSDSCRLFKYFFNRQSPGLRTHGRGVRTFIFLGHLFVDRNVILRSSNVRWLQCLGDGFFFRGRFCYCILLFGLHTTTFGKLLCRLLERQLFRSGAALRRSGILRNERGPVQVVLAEPCLLDLSCLTWLVSW